jgi:2-deoxy-D-gluconate 3-dehydrogenase
MFHMEAAMKAFDLTGRVAIVTGGNGGIGLGMARGLAQAGAALMIVGRDQTKSADAVAELMALGVEARSVAADLADEAACRSVVKETVAPFGRLDILVNNAGIGIAKRPEEHSVAEWHKVLDTNLTSAFVLSQAAYPELKLAGRGKIVNIGSMMSIFGASFAAAYAASKGGLVQLTKVLATAWAADNIQVNAVLPAGSTRPSPGPRAPRSKGSTSRCSRVRRPAAGACPRTLPESPSSSRAPHRTSSPAPPFQSTADSQYRDRD